MQDADDVFRIAAIKGKAGIGRFQCLRHNLLGGEVSIDHDDIAPMHHDLRHIHVGEVQDAAQHATVTILHQAFLVVIFNRAANFLLRG